MSLNDFLINFGLAIFAMAIYVEILRPILINIINRLIPNSWKKYKEHINTKKRLEGAQWAWGVYGTHSYTLLGLYNWVDTHCQHQTSFKEGVSQAILAIEDLEMSLEKIKINTYSQ